ncbi:MAG: 4-(cytidine 5'-diphospho)-2-C-methyl-D-erythritol kinase [Flavobacteriales bacterium]
MIVYPNAKINLGLNIHSKFENGYHALQSIFIPIPLFDILEIVETPNNTETQFSSTGISIPGKGNLCLDAYNLLKNDFDIPTVNIHLHKQIPIGAGLGGGSADASFTLTTLNNMFNLNIDVPVLEQYAKLLGADCPFFIENKPKFVEGIGEIMTPIEESPLKEMFLVLIFPEIHISTQEAYSGIRLTPKMDYNNIDFTQIDSFKDLFKNDFEYHIFKKHNKLASIKEQLYKEGAFYASMSGSGSTMYGLFKEEPDLNQKFGLTKIIKL